jgi:hypothetical protein
MWSRVFGARNLLPVPVVGQLPYDQEFVDAALEFLDTRRYPWPSRAASDLLKLRLQPYLDAPCFEYERESDLLAARGCMLKLWALALSRLTGTAGGQPTGAPSHRALSNVVLAIAQRNEFQLEYLGFRLPSKRSKKKGKMVRHSGTSIGPLAKAAAGAASATSAAAAAPAAPTTPSTPAAPAPPSLIQSQSTANRRTMSTTGATTESSFARAKSRLRSQSKVNAESLPPRQNESDGYYDGSSLPLPRMGAFDPKLRKQLDHGHEYCQLLGLTVVYMTGRIEDVETVATATNAARRKSMSGSLDSPMRKSSSTALYHHHELRFFATVIVLAYFRAPELIVPLIVQGARRALEDMAPNLLRMRVSSGGSKDSSQETTRKKLFRPLTVASDGPDNDEDATSAAEYRGGGGGGDAEGTDEQAGDDGKDGIRTLSKGSAEDERWAAVCKAFHAVQMAAMYSPSAQYRHTLFVAHNPTLFSWRAFYTELSPDLHDGLQKPSQWLKKLLTDGYFYALFMTEFVKHVGNVGKWD